MPASQKHIVSSHYLHTSLPAKGKWNLKEMMYDELQKNYVTCKHIYLFIVILDFVYLNI